MNDEIKDPRDRVMEFDMNMPAEQMLLYIRQLNIIELQGLHDALVGMKQQTNQAIALIKLQSVKAIINEGVTIQ